MALTGVLLPAGGRGTVSYRQRTRGSTRTLRDDGMSGAKRTGLLVVTGPGLLAAATGVGAGDLATGAFTGNLLGVAVLWAVAVGALVKFVLNEGLARSAAHHCSATRLSSSTEVS